MTVQRQVFWLRTLCVFVFMTLANGLPIVVIRLLDVGVLVALPAMFVWLTLLTGLLIYVSDRLATRLFEAGGNSCQQWERKK